MSAPATVLVLDAAQAGPQAQKFVASPDRLVVATDSPALARHALSTMAVTVWICDLSAQADFRNLAAIGRMSSPGLRILFTGAALLSKRAHQMLQDCGVPGAFVPKPWNGIALRKAVADQIAAAQKATAAGEAAPPQAAPAPGPGGRPVIRIAAGATLRHAAGAPAAAPVPAVAFQGPDPSHYEIVDVMGKGGTGTVFRARDRFLDIDVALKIVNRDLIEKPDVLASFKDEARITMQLSHRNILRLYGYQVYNGCHYLVMELVNGKTLRGVLVERGALSTPSACQILRHCAEALEYAHMHNVVHKDVKPENIYLTDACELKVIDFGSAVLNDARAEAEGVVVGTPEYMAPEQLRGDLVGPGADQYALAVTAYLMLVGCFPYPAETTTEDLLRGVRPDFSALPPELAAVFARATAEEPAFRYPSVTTFVDEVVRVCGCEEFVRNPYAPIVVESAAAQGG